ncbi:MAG: DUF1003 domain-containing protein [Phenylobacterium sp.]|jgi:uncharacterized membrane protein|uniref:DUF1003 domain-containing protein n=1 Tax=Phenylobacterium sp. TaxID=1871053 RepID=UPI0025D32EC5|nr:DUF1003 domain-containing protein [Phenylobacterium sp.]MCA6298448.1 DUF1003 domain-containing protein [Phenylobacterium sp.]
MTDLNARLHDAEARLLEELRRQRRNLRDARKSPDGGTLGQRIADTVAATIGSWPFIIVQSILMAGWVTLNVIAWIQHWDPYPFILLNLALSFQAAYAGPFILMSQNRQQDIDRRKAETDYQVNVKAELEIELLHQKLDALKEQELADLARAVRNLSELLEARRA